MRYWFSVTLAGLSWVVLAGCATRGVGGVGSSASAQVSTSAGAGVGVIGSNPKDPWEGVNRKVMGFNDAVDSHLLKPVAKGYQAVVPSPVRTGIGNFFSNLGELWSAVNHLLQGEFKRAGKTMGRFTINTFLGLGGVIDIASDAGIAPPKADFGQTLGRWGVPSGPYVVLPLLGPSTVRETGGLTFDLAASPLNRVHDAGARDRLQGLRLVQTRSELLIASDTLDEVALDRYTFLRDAYLQRRQSLLRPSKASQREPASGPAKDSEAKSPQEERFDLEDDLKPEENQPPSSSPTSPQK